MGPFLCDSHLGSPKDVSDQLLPMLERNRSLWKDKPAHFYADSGSSAGAYLDAIADEGWHYTVSYNKWTEPLERKAVELPALAWKRTGEVDHALLRHHPEGRKAPQLLAAHVGEMASLIGLASSLAMKPRPMQRGYLSDTISKEPRNNCSRKS